MALILPESSIEMIEDESHVSPPPGSVPTTSLPLPFFDIQFLHSTPFQRLFFYEFPHPTSYFLQTTLPKLKTSLSLTLQHFFPFSGKLIFPPLPQAPYILYTEGDSVSVFVCESTADFSHLAGDHARRFQEFQPLLPKTAPAIASRSSIGCMEMPIMAIQFTMFPNVGLSIGLSFSHAVADGKTLNHFMKSWSSVHRCGGDLACLDQNYLPCFNREYLINDPLGQLSGLFMDDEKIFKGSSPPTNVFGNNVRVTFRIKRCQVELLKDWVTKKCMEVNGSEPIRLSTFVVSCAYVWVCLIKLQESQSHDENNSSIDTNALSYFCLPIDCRMHVKLPATYFGNCIIPRLATAKKSELLGPNGILVAATALGTEIREFLKEPFKDAHESLLKIFDVFKMVKDLTFAASSPKFEVYKTDFGWGRLKKTEVANLGSFGTLSTFSTAENREDEGGVEFGLGLAPNELDSFNDVFEDGFLKLM